MRAQPGDVYEALCAVNGAHWPQKSDRRGYAKIRFTDRGTGQVLVGYIPAAAYDVQVALPKCCPF
jgi:hypothetical protein